MLLEHADTVAALARTLRDIDACLAADHQAIPIRVATESLVTHTTVTLPDAYWRQALGTYRLEIIQRLEALGVEI